MMSSINDSSPLKPSQADSPAAFPFQLYDLLNDAANEGFESIVSWLPEGDAFMVKEKTPFESQILPTYFKQTKFKSFQRQLNLYSFTRWKDGPRKGAYTHSSFRRGKRDWCQLIKRKKQAGTINMNKKTLQEDFATTSGTLMQVNLSPKQQNREGDFMHVIYDQSIFYKSTQDMSNQEWLQVHDEVLLADATSTVETWLPSRANTTLNKCPPIQDLINEIIYTFDNENTETSSLSMWIE